MATAEQGERDPDDTGEATPYPDDGAICPWCAGPMTETHRRQGALLGWFSRFANYRCDGCHLTVYVHTDAASAAP